MVESHKDKDMCYFQMDVMAGITGLTGFSYFREMMSYVFRGTMMS